MTTGPGQVSMADRPGEEARTTSRGKGAVRARKPGARTTTQHHYDPCALRGNTHNNNTTPLAADTHTAPHHDIILGALFPPVHAASQRPQAHEHHEADTNNCTKKTSASGNIYQVGRKEVLGGGGS